MSSGRRFFQFSCPSDLENRAGSRTRAGSIAISSCFVNPSACRPRPGGEKGGEKLREVCLQNLEKIEKKQGAAEVMVCYLQPGALKNGARAALGQTCPMSEGCFTREKHPLCFARLNAAKEGSRLQIVPWAERTELFAKGPGHVGRRSRWPGRIFRGEFWR